jgi:hypothetical protein
MSGINTDDFMLISFDLQKIALVLAVIGFIILRAHKLSEGKLRIHDAISTFGFFLVVLSVPYMINSIYDSIVSQTVSTVILIHSLIGTVIIFVGFIVAINRRDWKLKIMLKTKTNMQILLVLWVMNFIFGAYITLFT